MCGRMYMEPEDPTGELRSIMATLRYQSEMSAIKMSGEIFPSNIIPVILADPDSGRIVVPMKWGFSRFDGKGLIINARSETAAVKPMFRESAKTRRCIIPVSNYFEWQTKDNRKIKYALRPFANSLAFIAGLYKHDHIAKQETFTVLTRQASEKISFIHDRMPVMMAKDIIMEWLSPKNSYDDFINLSITDVEYRVVS